MIVTIGQPERIAAPDATRGGFVWASHYFWLFLAIGHSWRLVILADWASLPIGYSLAIGHS